MDIDDCKYASLFTVCTREKRHSTVMIPHSLAVSCRGTCLRFPGHSMDEQCLSEKKPLFPFIITFTITSITITSMHTDGDDFS